MTTTIRSKRLVSPPFGKCGSQKVAQALTHSRNSSGDRGRAQHQSVDVSDLAPSDTASITAVDPTRTLVFASNQALSGQGGGETVYGEEQDETAVRAARGETQEGNG